MLRQLVTVFGASALAVTLHSAPIYAQSDDVSMSGISGSQDKPRRHFRLRHPRSLNPDDALEIYTIAKGSLALGYARANVPQVKNYQTWRHYNAAPYMSVTHGNHYLNNYANDIARAYGNYENAGKLPVGAVIAKDSFSVTASGGILLGPLFVMEKMPVGFNPLTGDWKYMQIQPDGTFFGETNGPGTDRVEYCIACHLAVEEQDHLYFVPREYRVKSN